MASANVSVFDVGHRKDNWRQRCDHSMGSLGHFLNVVRATGRRMVLRQDKSRCPFQRCPEGSFFSLLEGVFSSPSVGCCGISGEF